MKRSKIFFIAAALAAVLLNPGSGPAALAEGPGQARAEESTKKQAEEISDEDREVIEHMEMLKNLRLYDNDDIDMLLTLDVLTANE